MSDAQIVSCVGESGQSNRVAICQPTAQSAVETRTSYSVAAYTFQRNVEKAVLAKVKSEPLNYVDRWYVSRVVKDLSQARLHSAARDRATAMARHVVFYCLYMDKKFGPLFTCTRIGEDYGRDPTVVMDAINKICDLIACGSALPKARIAQAVMAEMACA